MSLYRIKFFARNKNPLIIAAIVLWIVAMVAMRTKDVSVAPELTTALTSVIQSYPHELVLDQVVVKVTIVGFRVVKAENAT